MTMPVTNTQVSLVEVLSIEIVVETVPEPFMTLRLPPNPAEASLIPYFSVEPVGLVNPIFTEFPLYPGSEKDKKQVKV